MPDRSFQLNRLPTSIAIRRCPNRVFVGTTHIQIRCKNQNYYFQPLQIFYFDKPLTTFDELQYFFKSFSNGEPLAFIFLNRALHIQQTYSPVLVSNTHIIAGHFKIQSLY